jgi:hypothetical protein
MLRRTILALSLTLGVTLSSTPARADVFVIDDTTLGTLYDGLLDGFPFPPPGVTPDGQADFAGNALAVALQTGVTEERGIAEMSLATLIDAGITSSSQIDSATLTVTIDDVISTFGPGTTFDGTAASSIVVFAYNGNGTIELADFQNVAGAPAGVIDTTPHGVITDATLSSTGPLQFNVSITAALGALLNGSATHVGFVFATQDAGSATSIDNLGPSGSGPPGVGGAAMPFITITTVVEEAPVFGKAELKCQKALATQMSKFVKTKTKSLTKCFDAVLGAVSKGKDIATVEPGCQKALDLDDAASTMSKTIAKVEEKIVAACVGLAPEALGSPCSEEATDFEDVAECLLEGHEAAVDATVRSTYASACAILTEVGLEDDYAGVCTD